MPASLVNFDMSVVLSRKWETTDKIVEIWGLGMVL